MAQKLISRRGLILGGLAAPFVITNPALAAIGGGFCPPGGGGWGTSGGGGAAGGGYENPDIVNADVPSLSGNREVYLRHARTGQQIGGQYLANGQFVESFLEQFNAFARDDRTKEQVKMSAGLLDIVSQLAEMLGTGTAPWQVNSAFRSRKTNASVGGDKNSLHMKGMALDISHPQKPPSAVQGCAKKIGRGGVGHYATFTHVDTGNVRVWWG